MKGADDGKGQAGHGQQRQALGEVVVPGVVAVEDGDVARHVDVEKDEERKGPGAIEEAVRDGRDGQDGGSAGGDLDGETEEDGPGQTRRHAVQGQPGHGHGQQGSPDQQVGGTQDDGGGGQQQTDAQLTGVGLAGKEGFAGVCEQLPWPEGEGG